MHEWTNEPERSKFKSKLYHLHAGLSLGIMLHVPSLSFCFLVSKKERIELCGTGLCKEK